MTAIGTKQTNWTGLLMSVDRGGPEMAGRPSTDAIDPERTLTLALLSRTHQRSSGNHLFSLLVREARLPGIVFSGEVSGYLHAYATADARLLWEVDTARDYATVDGVSARGAVMQGQVQPSRALRERARLVREAG